MKTLCSLEKCDSLDCSHILCDDLILLTTMTTVWLLSVTSDPFLPLGLFIVSFDFFLDSILSLNPDRYSVVWVDPWPAIVFSSYSLWWHILMTLPFYPILRSSHSSLNPSATPVFHWIMIQKMAKPLSPKTKLHTPSHHSV